MMRSLLWSSLPRQGIPSSPPTHPQHASSKPVSSDDPASSSPRSTSLSSTRSSKKHAHATHADSSVTVTVKPVRCASSSTLGSSSLSPSPSPSVSSSLASSEFDVAMVKRGRAKRASDSLSPSSPPSTTTSLCRPTTPTSPVQIPKHANRDSAHTVKRPAATHHRRRHPRHHAHDPESLSPSLAALLAVTDIPRQTRRRRKSDKPLTVDEIVGDQHVSEKELSLTLSRGPMDVLLSPPDDLADDDASLTESNVGSALARTTSIDSIPSLGDSFVTDMLSSVDTPRSQCSQKRRLSPMRKSLEPVRSPPDATEEHPLAGDALDLEELDLQVLGESVEGESTKLQFLEPFKPLRSVFKSNLTASLRALRSAAKSFSSINFPSIPPDDFLTRSILTIDPNVPYADERRPPVTEEMPSAELRRYLNPTTSSLIDPQPKPRRAFSASIQMQTYKVQRSRSPHPSVRSPYPSTSPQSASTGQQTRPPTPAPGMRQREMRENSDFIRIAVMEMAMRRSGKLDNQRPGRARWALPPRRPSTKPYEVATNGVPVRWTSLSYD